MCKGVKTTKYKTETEYEYKNHGYISIKYGNIENKIFNCYINKIFGPFIYTIKYLYYK